MIAGAHLVVIDWMTFCSDMLPISIRLISCTFVLLNIVQSLQVKRELRNRYDAVPHLLFLCSHPTDLKMASAFG